MGLMFTMTSATTLQQAFAPTGRLRACINLGNPILARRAAGAELPTGVSVDLAGALAQQLGLALDLVVFETASEAVQAVREERADIGFFAIDPLRAQGLRFTAPYVLIEGSYLVPQASALQHNEEVDRPGIRVVVGRGSAYDLFLGRALQCAEIVRAPSSQTVVETFVQQRLEVAAGVRQQLQADLARFAGHRLLPGRFMVIEQAMGLAQSRGEAAAAHLARFVEGMKAGGFVAQSMARHGIEGASVAPALEPPVL